MPIVEPLQRPEKANGSGKIRGRLARVRKETESKERIDAAQTADSVAAVQRERERVIAARASTALRNSPYHAVRRVSCEVRSRVLTLRGRVPSFYMKQMAQTVIRHLLDGGMVIDDQVEVDQT